MAGAVLVDSSVFIALLRRGEDPAEVLVAEHEDLYACGMVRVEVLRGMRTRRGYDRLGAFFDVLCNVPVDNALWESAAALAWQIDRSGWTLPAQDILIGACALRAGVPVLTQDRHFDRIPGVVAIPFE